MSGKGALYIVSTPIGNLGDITLRAIETLRQADIIAAEDTRHTMKLLSRLDIHTKLVSYHQHSGAARTNQLVDMLEEGIRMALVTDAGTPIISDPGSPLVAEAVGRGVDVFTVPGACAAISALTLSALPADKFVFEGFLPKERRAVALERAMQNEYTTILYESPHQIIKTLQTIAGRDPRRQLSVCRELTKLHESVFRGTAEEASAHFAAGEARGEFVIVLAGRPAEDVQPSPEAIRHALLEVLAGGGRGKDAVRQVAAALGAPKNEVYRIYLELGASDRGEA